MFRNKMILSAALSTLCFAASQTVLAPVASAAVVHGANIPAHATPSAKMVKFSIANSGKETLNLMVGTQAMTVQPGKTIDAQAAAGTSITVVDETSSHKAGEVLTQITKDFGGSTVRIS